MFDSDLDKYQAEDVPRPEDQPEGIVISPDTRRANRIPPGQSRTRKWPVLDAAGPPKIDLASWKLEIGGLVERPATLDLGALSKMPRVRVFSDFHCVTRWSRLGNLWEGVSTKEIAALAGAISPRARYVLVYGYDFGWTTNLPVEMFLASDALLATHHDGTPIRSSMAVLSGW